MEVDVSDISGRRVYRTWIADSRRWDHWRPRAGDVVIATYPKCGTTWMQQIVGLLIFQTPEPRPLSDIADWVDRRQAPIERVTAKFEAQTHRRFMKAHMPFDGLPYYPQACYIHVARDGRDACLSFHNQLMRRQPEALKALDEAGLGDEAIGRPFPRVPDDPAAYFRMWLTEGVNGASDGTPYLSYFDLEATWWTARRLPNVLMVHYRDLKADLDGEMRRIAGFLGIAVPEAVWPTLVEAATFERMRAVGLELMPRVRQMFAGGAADFFQKGENDRWRGVLSEVDLALYEQKLHAKLSPACAHWLRHGRRGSMEPGLAPD
jgi:aryl sulfotransferase